MPGSILDVIAPNANPFAATNGSGSGTQASDTSYFPPAPPAPDQGVMTSRFAPQGQMERPSPFSPGSVFWLLSGGASKPTQTEYLAGIEEQQKRQLGITRQKAFSQLGKLVEQGNSPQQAFLKFLQTPEGTEFVVSDPDPQGAIGDFLKMATPDPSAAARASVFGGTASPTAGPPVAGQPQGGNSGIQPTGQPNGAVMPGNPLAGVDPKNLRLGAQKLAAIGDYEGANLALKMADGYDTLSNGPTTDELKEYDKYEKQEQAAGRQPKSWLEYKLMVTKEANPKVDPAQSARVEVDKEAAKTAGEAALAAQSAMPILDEIQKLSTSVRGGYAGSFLPQLTRIATSFGIEVPKEWDDAQVLQALSQRLLPLVRQPGQVSNYEQQTYMNALPGLMQTPQGRAKIIVAMRKQAERAQQIAQVYRDNIGSPKLYAPDGPLAALDKSMFTPEEMDEFVRFANEGPASQPGQQPLPPSGQQSQTPQGAEPMGDDMPIGSIRDGKNGTQWRYKGGGRSNSANWERVK